MLGDLVAGGHGHDRSREPHRYAGRSSIGVGSVVPNASAGVAHPSARCGRWLTLAATELSVSWVSVDRSAFLYRYWCSSRLVFSWVPCRPAARARIRDAFERRPRCRGDVHERDPADSRRYHTGEVAPHSHRTAQRSRSRAIWLSGTDSRQTRNGAGGHQLPAGGALAGVPHRRSRPATVCLR